MKACIVSLAAAIVVAGVGVVQAASVTVTMNAIDANGVGKQIGTLRLSDIKAGLRIAPQLAGLRQSELRSR
jgi:superoxide dismutase, Cu-Zn family